MSYRKNSKENKKSKSYLSEDKQSKSIDNEKSKKNIEKIREKEKFLVNKYSKLQKAEEKKSDSQAKKDLLNKIYLNIFIYTLNKNLKKNENFEISSKNFVEKQNCESNVEYYRTDYKNQKFSKKFVIDSEKNEISKTAKISTNKIKFKNGRVQENENKNNYKRKNIKLNKNEIYENNPNEYYEENNKKLKLNDVYINKYKLCRNDYLDDFIDNKNILENIKIKRKERKYKIKYYRINIIYFYYIMLNIVLFSQYVKCYKRKIELAYSYINLKIIGNGTINIYSNFYNGDKPDIVSINNQINLTDIGTNYHYNFINSENDINNITLIWNTPLTSTKNLFKGCRKIIEIDLSYFDSSQVNDMSNIFDGCSNLISLNLSNFNTSSVTSMVSMFNFCSSLISLDLSYFDTSQVNSMNLMFNGCSNLISLNLSNFNTSSVTSMKFIFSGCLSLISLDLSYFDTSQVNSMNYMMDVQD